MAVEEKRNISEDFGNRLRGIIEKRKKETGQNLRDMAKDLDVSLGVLSDWQNGNKTPRGDSIAKLAKYFGVSADYLLGLTGSMSSEITMRMITDTTGLSDDAVNALYKRKCFNDECSKFHLAKYSTEDPSAIKYRNECGIVSKIISDGTIFELAGIIREAFEINQILKGQTEVFASEADVEKIVAQRYNDDFLKRLAPLFYSYGYDNHVDLAFTFDCMDEESMDVDYTALAEQEFENFKASRAHLTDAQFIRELYFTKEKYKEDLSYREYKSCSIVHDFVERFLNKQHLPDDSYVFKDFFERHEDEDKEMEAATSCNVDEN